MSGPLLYRFLMCVGPVSADSFWSWPFLCISLLCQGLFCVGPFCVHGFSFWVCCLPGLCGCRPLLCQSLVFVGSFSLGPCLASSLVCLGSLWLYTILLCLGPVDQIPSMWDNVCVGSLCVKTLLAQAPFVSGPLL